MSRKSDDIKRWRRDDRHRAVVAALGQAKSIRWSARLLELLFEELYADDKIEQVLGARVRDLQRPRYAEAVATALILRHSWRPDDLALIVKRLGRGRKDDFRKPLGGIHAKSRLYARRFVN